MEKSDSRQKVEKLVSNYKERRDEFKSDTYNETEARNDFIDPLFEALGWDVSNESNKPRHMKEVKVEASVVDEEENTRKPDYEFRDERGERKFFVEAKKPSVSLGDKQAIQVRRYGWNATLPVSILTNFEKLIIYDTTEIPEEDDSSNTARLREYSYDELVDNFDEIYEMFSREAVVEGEFDESFEDPKEQKREKQFDSIFLEQLETWRERLAENITENNPDISEDQLNYMVHRILNRVIFLRICEDRNQEPYEKLKNEVDDIDYERLRDIFKEADRKYDSKLFELFDSYNSENIDLDASVIAEILKELYYPDSPYTFAVVESHIIGKIYDLFLGKKLTLENGDFTVENKPEVKHSQGVVTTPKEIVDEIVEETVQPEIEGKSPEKLEGYSVADICCGSGIFLISAYETIANHYREWYKENDESKLDEYGEDKQLSLSERNRILEEHIFGVDIDQLAVEVARFSILLKVLEDQPGGSIESYMEEEGKPILPDASEHIKVGNSLVNEEFFDYINGSRNEQEILEEVQPFNFNEKFSEVNEGGFDCILGNPPYVRIQNLVEYRPDKEMEFIRRDEGYFTAQKNNYDKYYLFIERSVSLLDEGGNLGYIIPQKFLSLKSGENLRKLIADDRLLSNLVHFGVEQVFPDRSTYTCILNLSRTDHENFTVEKVSNLESWIKRRESEIIEKNLNELDSESWSFVSDQTSKLFQKLETTYDYTLADVADIFVGVQTSWNKFYEIKDHEEEEGYLIFEGPEGEERKIEKGITKPYFYTNNKWKRSVPQLSKVKPNGRIIYPYEDGDIIPKEDMKENYPKAWDYFESYKERDGDKNDLVGRDINGGEEPFYKYGRSQSIGKMEEEKVITQVLSLEPRYAYDDSETVVTGGGNGPFYNIRSESLESIDEDVPENILDSRYLMAVLSHPVIEAKVRAGSSFFRDGYYSHGKQFIEDAPIKLINESDDEEVELYQDICDLVERRMEAIRNKREADTESNRQLYDQQSARLLRQIQGKVTDLYGFTEDEIETASGV